MAALLVVVFLVCLLFAVLPEYIPDICKKVVALLVQETENERGLKENLRQLYVEIKTINMMDEFAKYAKTERRINKLKEELKDYSKTRNDALVKVKVAATLLLHVLQVIIVLSIIWSFRSQSLLSIPNIWTWPLSFLISFPSRLEDAVGVTWWFIVCRSVVKKGLDMYKDNVKTPLKNSTNEEVH